MLEGYGTVEVLDYWNKITKMNSNVNCKALNAVYLVNQKACQTLHKVNLNKFPTCYEVNEVLDYTNAKIKLYCEQQILFKVVRLLIKT